MTALSLPLSAQRGAWPQSATATHMSRKSGRQAGLNRQLMNTERRGGGPRPGRKLVGTLCKRVPHGPIQHVSRRRGQIDQRREVDATVPAGGAGRRDTTGSSLAGVFFFGAICAVRQRPSILTLGAATGRVGQFVRTDQAAELLHEDARQAAG